MDFIHIFPVIQWLVKKSIEFRASKGEAIKRHAIRRFNTCHPDLQEVRKTVKGIRGEKVHLCAQQQHHHSPLFSFFTARLLLSLLLIHN